MAVSTPVYIVIFYFGLATVQSYVCVNQHQSHSQSDADCANNLSNSQCQFRQDDNLINKENNNEENNVNPAFMLPKQTNDYVVENGHFSNGVTEKGSETISSGESNNNYDSNLHVDLQNGSQVNLDANSTVPEFVTDITVGDVAKYSDDMSKNEINSGLTKQSNAIDISDIGKDTKKQIKCQKSSAPKYESTNELKCSNVADNCGSSISDTANTELNHSESKETPISSNVTPQINYNIQNPLIILNNQQTTNVLVTNSLDSIRPNEYREQSKGFFINMQGINSQVSPNNGIGLSYGNIVNLNSGTTSYTLVTIPSDGNGISGVNSGTMYTLNNIPSSFVQASNGEYYSVPNTIQSYYTTQLVDGQIILIPNNNGQSLMSVNRLVKLVPLNNLQVSVVRMQNIPVIRQASIQVLGDGQQMMPPQVFELPLHNQGI